MIRRGKEEAARRQFWKNLADLVYTLASIFSFIADWKEREKKAARKARTAPNFDAEPRDG